MPKVPARRYELSRTILNDNFTPLDGGRLLRIQIARAAGATPAAYAGAIHVAGIELLFAADPLRP